MPPIDEAALRDKDARKSERAGVIMGAAAVAIAIVGLSYVAALPAGILLLDVALVWGLLSLVRVLSRWKAFVPDNAFLAAVLPALALPTLARFLAGQHGIALPMGLRYTIAFPVVLLAAISTLLYVLYSAQSKDDGRWRVRATAVGWVVGLVVCAMFAVLVRGAADVQAGAWATLGLTVSFVLGGLTIQANAHRFLSWRHARLLASPPALLLTATQLLDGTVSYLAVGNPFSLLAQPSHEQIALSAFLIEWTGPGYVLAKWALALVIIRILDGPGVRHRLADPFHRFMLYLVMAYVGMGPAIYSTVRLFI